MSDNPSTRHPRELAAAADPAWVDAFVVELRLLGVPGDEIGDHLVVLDTHLRESGESVEEAFGDPREYAGSLAPSGGTAAPVDRSTVVVAVLALVGVVLVPAALGALLDGTRVTVTLGGVLVAVLLGTAVAALVAPGAPLLALLVRRRWMAFLVTPVLVAVGAALVLLLPQVLVRVPAPVVGVAGLVAVLAGSVLLGRAPADLVTAPGERAPGAEPDGVGRLLGVSVLPVCALVACVPVLMMRLLG